MSFSTIRLSGMEFRAFHGCYDLEKKVGNHFIVDLELDADVDVAASTDDISRTVNYLDVYELVAEQMAITSDIIENVAWRIGDAILAKFALVDSLKVTVTKMAPPLGGKIRSVSATICKSRTCGKC